jgi:adenylate cyclase
MGEIVVVKKEIIFTGDVLNTTARIQGLCNSCKVDLLLSENLLNILEKSDRYQRIEIGETELRGRQEKIKLFTVSEISCTESDPV